MATIRTYNEKTGEYKNHRVITIAFVVEGDVDAEQFENAVTEVVHGGYEFEVLGKVHTVKLVGDEIKESFYDD